MFIAVLWVNCACVCQCSKVLKYLSQQNWGRVWHCSLHTAAFLHSGGCGLSEHTLQIWNDNNNSISCKPESFREVWQAVNNVYSVVHAAPVCDEGVGLVRVHDQRLQLSHLFQDCRQLLPTDAIPQAAISHHQALQRKQITVAFPFHQHVNTLLVGWLPPKNNNKKKTMVLQWWKKYLYLNVHYVIFGKKLVFTDWFLYA